MAGDITQLGETSEPDWADLEYLLSDFARLAKSDVPFERVARELLDCAVDALAAVGAAIWLADEPDCLRLERQVNLAALGDLGRGEVHRRLLIETVRAGRPEVLEPDESGGAANPTEYTLVLVPIHIDQDAAGLVEVIQRPTLTSDALDGNVRFTSLLAELAADHLRRREVRDLRLTRQETRQFQEFLHVLHRTLDPRATAAELANGGRRQIGCDRASVAIRRGSRYRLAAVSSVDVINRRSAAVKRLERLIARVAATGDELWRRDDDESLAPQIERALSEYLDQSHACTVGIIPLRGPAPNDRSEGPLIGALVVEGFDARPWDESHETTRAVARHGALALANSLQYQSLPTLPLLRHRPRTAGAPTRRIIKTAAALALVAAIGSTFFIRVDFHVYAEGELQPEGRNHVFAPLDGQVSIVSVKHGDEVRAGQTILEMSSPELDLEIQKIQGEHDATMQRSVAIDSALLDYGSSLDPEAAKFNQLAAEQEELRQLFASQKVRLAVLRAQRDMLLVASPIDGEVLTWETDEQLLNRPVSRGQRLLTVACLTGPWEAELRVPDDQAGPLLTLSNSGKLPLACSYELATQRGVVHQGEVTRVARRTEIDADDQPIVRVRMQVDKLSLAAPRPGATVYAKIHCGERSVFYLWCHDLVDRVIGWLRF